MIKIYLDQKDYINIASGILSGNEKDENVECVLHPFCQVQFRLE